MIIRKKVEIEKYVSFVAVRHTFFHDLAKVNTKCVLALMFSVCNYFSPNDFGKQCDFLMVSYFSEVMLASETIHRKVTLNDEK